MPAPRTERTATVRKKELHPVDIDSFGGLNLVSQDDAMDNNDSPFLQNIRKFATKKDDRRVGLSTRQGSSFYTVPIGEALDTPIGAAGVGDAPLSSTKWQAVHFTPADSRRITKIGLSLKENNGQGIIRIELRRDEAGLPGEVIGETSIPQDALSSVYEYVEARFIAAPLVDNHTRYWIVAFVQEGGSGEYHWELDGPGGSYSSLIGDGGFTVQSGALISRVYASDTGGVKGISRYYPKSGTKETIFAHNESLYRVNDNTGETFSIKNGLSPDATSYHFSNFQDLKLICNSKDTPQKYDGTTVTDLGGSPVNSSMGIFHKNRLFLFKPDDTRAEFSEIADFETFLSTSFLYVPIPSSTDPIQYAESFQDNLTIITRRSKYVLYGSNLSDFELRQSMAKNGCTGPNAVASDGNKMYFLGDDNFYEYNGASDNPIGTPILPLLDSIPDKSKVAVTYNDNEVRLYYPLPGQSAPSNIAILNTIFNEWFVDTEAFAKMTEVLAQEDGSLIEGSSLVGALYRANTGYNNLGAPIKADWWSKYFSFEASSVDKRIKKLFTTLRTQSTKTIVNLAIDRDYEDDPKNYSIEATGEGTLWNQFNWDEANWASSGLMTDKKVLSGRSNYSQLRYSCHGVNTPMEIIKIVIWYQMGRLT